MSKITSFIQSALEDMFKLSGKSPCLLLAARAQPRLQYLLHWLLQETSHLVCRSSEHECVNILPTLQAEHPLVCCRKYIKKNILHLGLLWSGLPQTDLTKIVKIWRKLCLSCDSKWIEISKLEEFSYKFIVIMVKSKIFCWERSELF